LLYLKKKQVRRLVLNTASGASRLAGFRGLDLINLALTTNARGGPGIVLASVAFDAGIINASFYTTLVVAAVVTSQIAGAWIEYILHKGWPLLTAPHRIARSPYSLRA
jgi:Kef-type K+ transport system membrane component KefB